VEIVTNIDKSILSWLNSWVGQWPLIDHITYVLVSDYFVPVSMALFMLGLWFSGNDAKTRQVRQKTVIRALIAIGLSNLVVLIINDYYFRPRPFNEIDVNLLFYKPTDSSFPANPAAVSFAIAHSVIRTKMTISKLPYVLAILWSSSRIFSGVFYPLDAIAGAAIGITISIITGSILQLSDSVHSFVIGCARKLHLA